ncbi:glutamate formimidoyltransferase FtcD [Clostridium aceticum]|uniref:glutamate formimidoyltransferase n=1 Tax=Clostridium aceticum TaxID=84022 RepID=A0A0D8I751_9CLOT|nr:glutamate formimidoyltransferase [Clostridium aceticum]AKL93821.1 glutamate formimidoyltransferase FtcD [Clostridium aceticum]KJF25847.1 glutamate formiminotransferase [Clostridium aceticum]
MKKLIECVPNFSEGRNTGIVEEIIDEVRKIEGITILDYSSDKDHNRTVLTMIGSPERIKEAAINSARKAAELIDMSKHEGAHPRMGATDVIPFTPVAHVTIEECIEVAKEVGAEIGNWEIPVYLYEDAATTPDRKNLASVRKGQYEGFFEKINKEEWKPDFGPQAMNAKSGCTAVGVRVPLVAYNINLDTPDVEIADKIAKKVRHLGGGLVYVKAIGLKLEERNQTQVSMNLVNYEKTAIYQAFEMVKIEAKRYGANVVGSEVIGTVPMKSLLDAAEYYLQIENFSMEQILEKRLLDEQ